MMLGDAANWSTGEARNEGVTLRFLQAGRGPLVIMLHGFPDSPLTWRFQRDAIVQAGFRVVTPWLRGYGPSGKPRRVSDYDVRTLAGDVATIVESLGESRAAAVIGHDWGGAIAWRLAAERPQLVERLIILNSPHPSAFARELRTPGQLARSWYVVFFQLPWLPETLMRAHRMAGIRRSIARMVRRREAFTEEDWIAIHAALAVPGALRAALSYYRAAGRAMLRGRSGAAGRLPRIAVPTMVLWGEQDDALSARLSYGLERYVSTLTVRRFANAGHWVHWDEPEAVATEIVAFLSTIAA